MPDSSAPRVLGTRYVGPAGVDGLADAVLAPKTYIWWLKEVPGGAGLDPVSYE